MIKILQVRNIDSFVESRRQKTSEKDKKTVQAILNDVKKNGDSAVKKYEQKFNGRKTSQLRVSAKEIKEAQSKISRKEVIALRDMSVRLLPRQKILADPEQWLEAGSVFRKFVPIPSVGCYIPGGQARYPSSVVMSVIPEKIVGVKRIVVISPPGRDGKIDPLTIVAAKMCGATEIYKVGGAQAIGALAYGTKSIPKVDKIVGPGGKFVSIAKWLVSEQTAIDMIAGPTELGIIADASSNPELIALDLISQAEHSKDTMCFVITRSKTMAEKIQESVERVLDDLDFIFMIRESQKDADRDPNLPYPTIEQLLEDNRKAIIKESISKNGFIAVCKNQNEVIELANKIAPEHMQLMVKNAKSLSKKITGAGLLLIGKNTPSAASDYLLGTNHILPTNGFGRTRGGLSILDFSKLQTIVASSKSSLRKISKSLKTLTDAEDLPNHYKAIKRRLD